jgi:hypothetical protein
LDEFRAIPTGESSFGLVHFDFSDENYHINMSTGKITVFDSIPVYLDIKILLDIA